MSLLLGWLFIANAIATVLAPATGVRIFIRFVSLGCRFARPQANGWQPYQVVEQSPRCGDYVDFIGTGQRQDTASSVAENRLSLTYLSTLQYLPLVIATIEAELFRCFGNQVNGMLLTDH